MIELTAEKMGDFWAEWAAETLNYANHYRKDPDGIYYEEAASELLTLANDCYRLEVRLPRIPI